MILNLNLPSIIILIIVLICVFLQLFVHIKKGTNKAKCYHCSCSNCNVHCDYEYILKKNNMKNPKEVEELEKKFEPNYSAYKKIFYDNSLTTNIKNEKILLFKRTFDNRIISIIRILDNHIFFIIKANEKNKDIEMRLLRELLNYLKKKKIKNIFIYNENDLDEHTILNCNCTLKSVELLKDEELYLKRFSITL